VRKVKFRAWDKVNKEMYEVKFLEWEQRGKKRVSPADPIMQFTGLLDKNGKEIYEGDIVRWKDPYGASQKYTQQVIFSDGCFKVSHFNEPLSEAMRMSQGGEITEMEVIGNAYENPALLKDKGGRNAKRKV